MMNILPSQRLLTIIIAIITITVTVSPSLYAQTRRALVIGIGQQEDKAWGKINGDRDVPFVEEMLKNAKFKTSNVKKLVNQQATKAAIVNAFKSLTSQSRRGDMVYVHFSGHGQQMKDVHNDEKDGLDECWIPYDAYRKPCDRDRGEKHLTDDEVNYYLNAIRDKIGDSGKMLVVIDACHSGDATRGDDDEVVRGVEDIFEAIKSYIWGASAEKPKTDVNPNAHVKKERWITISACRSDQVNIEMKSPAVGKLTYAIYNKVKESTGNDNVFVKPDEQNQACLSSAMARKGRMKSNGDFFRRVRMFVNSNTGSRPQYPVMTGETDRYRITDIIR
ncbi:MAG: caspase family protein [Prevotella sp.]